MKSKILPILFFVSISVCGMAQTSKSATTDEIFTFAEEMPRFIGEGGFPKYLATHIQYPEAERKARKHGTVYISFVVEKNGSITNVEEVKGVPDAPGFTKEAIRVISAMPDWKPGVINGVRVRIRMTQPVRFVLDNDVEEKQTKIKPSFPGGDSALAVYLEKNLIYPEKEKEKHKEGTVVISFMVETDGSITDIQVITEIPGAPGFTIEAKRLIKAMPKWEAGKVHGTVSRLPVEVSVEFKL